MAYQALYRKYRPATFSDVVGQEHITETLKHELESGKISHAYLFTGTRGTGKTSCAKILAKAVNCLSPKNGDPCGNCEMCLATADGEITDIVEIDAASNNSVDSIRELRDQVAFPPAAAKFRVYIIDEVHMLTISAFNALLKTLEEPPAYVVFILATTEVHKLPATILSRCQRFDFRRIEVSKICERIQFIAEKEGLTVTDDAATLIASAADGGMRDALSILDLCASGHEEIDEEVVASVCSMAGNEYLLQLANHIKTQDTEAALLLLDELHNASVDMQRLLGELTEHYRNLMIVKTVKTGKKPVVCSAAQLKALEDQATDYDIKDIMAVLTVLQAAAAKIATGNRRCEMEMTIIRLCSPAVFTDLASLERRVAALETGRPAAQKPAQTAVKPQQTAPMTTPTAQKTVQTAQELQESSPCAPPQTEDDDEIPLPTAPTDSDSDEQTGAAVKPQSTQQSNPQEGEKSNLQNGATHVEEWDKILKILRSSCPLIAGVLQGSCAYIKGEYLLIDAQNSQFRNLVNGENPLYRDHIRKAAQTVLGQTYKLGPYRSAKADKGDPLAAFAEKLKTLEQS